MRRFLLPLMGIQFLWASQTSLDEILRHAKIPKLLNEKIIQEAQAHQSQTLADTQASPLTLNHALAYNDGVDDSGVEHAIGLSKEFILGNIQSLEQRQQRLKSEANLLEQQKELISLENQLKNLYHQHCLDDAYLENFQERYNTFGSLYTKKEIAYAQGEIAKTELLQLQLEQNRLKIELENLKDKEQSSREQLLSLTSMAQSNRLSCQDTYPINANISITQQAFSLSQEAYKKRIESTQAGLQRHAHKIESVEVSLDYSKELVNDIYTIGVSVPLNFSSQKSNYAKAALMHQSSAIALEQTQALTQKAYQLNRLMNRLQRDVKTIHAQEENIQNYTNNLLPLMKKSYDYGESSVIEYLLSQEKLYTLQQTLLEQKKDYYQTLFELYSISEIKDKS